MKDQDALSFPSVPPPYGRRLLPQIIDERANADHARPYASIPSSSNANQGFTHISYRTFANAINRCAQWIVQNLGHSTSGEVLAYIASPDLRYQILAMAALKAGYVMFFPSPRNTIEAYHALFDSADVYRIICPSQPLPTVRTLLEQKSMQPLSAPSLEELLNDQPVPPMPLHGSFEDHRFKPMLLLHTSGSTGTPKIVIMKHGLFATIDAFARLPESQTVPYYGAKRIFSPFPPFHIAGINYTLSVPLYVDSTAVFPPAGMPITSDLVHSIHTHGSVNSSILSPSTVHDLTQNEEHYAALGRLDVLTFSGGPLSEQAAYLVSQKTMLASSMGATEYGGIPVLPKDREDWGYFRFDETGAGIEWRESGEAGLFELVFVRKAELDLLQGIFVTFPELAEYHTKDCFSKHPTKPGLWKYESRLDDIVVLSNGEKLNPVPMERILLGCPAVKGILICGQGKFQASLLVEPKCEEMSQEEVLKKLQPYIKEANSVCPKYGKLSEGLVQFTKPGRPLPRASKGTVQRARSYTLYKVELDALYATDSDPKDSTPSELNLTLAPEASLHSYVCRTLDIELHKLHVTDDIFSFGMDSLHVLTMVKDINKARGVLQEPVNQAFIYQNPTVRSLANALSSGVRIRDYSEFDPDDEVEKYTWSSMEEAFQGGRAKLLSSASSRVPARTWNDIFRSTAAAPLYPADGGIVAWLQVVGAFLVNMNNWGLVNSFGVYQAYYETSLLSSFSPSSISWVGTLQGSLLLIVGVLSGPLFDKGYFRCILVTAGIGVVLALMLLSLAQTYYQVMLSQGVLLGLCLGFLYVPSIAVIPLYFKSRRGLALGLATSGGSFGGVVYPLVFRSLITSLGFPWANRIIGFVALTTMTLSTFLIRPLGPRSTRELFDLSAFTDLAYATFTIAGVLLFAGALLPFVLIAIYAKETLTLSTDATFHLVAILNAAQFLGRVLPALVMDWIGVELLLLGAEASISVVAFCWVVVHSSTGLYLWIIVYGFLSGMVVTLPAIVLPYITPSMAVLGTRLGMLYAMSGVGYVISAPVALALNRSSDEFLGAKIWMGACCAAAVGFFAVTAREARKRRLLYEANGARLYLMRKRR